MTKDLGRSTIIWSTRSSNPLSGSESCRTSAENRSETSDRSLLGVLAAKRYLDLLSATTCITVMSFYLPINTLTGARWIFTIISLLHVQIGLSSLKVILSWLHSARYHVIR